MMTTAHFQAIRQGLRIALCTAVAVHILTACGGSKADITGTGDDPGASEQGEIKALGSLVVNGTRYLTDESTDISVDGIKVAESDLQLGMVVDVLVARADLGIDGATALRINAQSLLDGEISQIDLNTKSLQILGVSVTTSEFTRYSDGQGQPLSFNELSIGDQVKISGFAAASGAQATLIRRTGQNSTRSSLQGVIAQLNTSTLQFQLNGVTVDYQQASEVQSINGLSDGDTVEVFGALDAQQNFIASRLKENQDAAAVPADFSTTFEGIVTAVDANSVCPELTYTVSGRKVRSVANTQYERGACADLKAGSRVTVQGRYTRNKDIVASKVELPQPVDARLIAVIEDILRDSTAADANTATQNCRIRVLGDLEIVVNRDTRQGQTSDNRGFGCADIRVGQLIGASGRFLLDTQSKTLQASYIYAGNQDQAQSFIAVAGAVQEIEASQRQLNMLGTLIQMTAATQYPNSSEVEFFGKTTAGDFIQITGEWNGASITASQAKRGFGERLECCKTAEANPQPTTVIGG